MKLCDAHVLTHVPLHPEGSSDLGMVGAESLLFGSQVVLINAGVIHFAIIVHPSDLALCELEWTSLVISGIEQWDRHVKFF